MLPLLSSLPTDVPTPRLYAHTGHYCGLKNNFGAWLTDDIIKANADNGLTKSGLTKDDYYDQSGFEKVA